MLRKIILTIVLGGIFILLYAPQTDAAELRIDGKNRFEVAINVSQKGWSNSNTVILTNYLAYADALSASPLAFKKNAPILLTQNQYITPSTKSEIIRLRAKEAVIIGGTGSISIQAANELKAMGLSVTRIDGKDRFIVAQNISKQLSNKGKAVIAYGLNFPDALAIAPYAARNEYPILLTGKDSLPSATKAALREKNITSTVIIGGEGSVSNTVKSQLPSPSRIGGANRFEVAENVIRHFNLSTQNVFLSSGMDFADALTGSVLAAKKNAPLLLTIPTRLPNETKSIIKDRTINTFTILGGKASVNTNSTALLGKTIVLDPGHGDHDAGASGNGLQEKDIVLDVGIRTRDKMVNAGAKIVMTRTTDTFLALRERSAIGNNSGADSFISIHSNAAENPAAHGTEVYYDTSFSSFESRRLAEEIQKELVKRMGTSDRGEKQANFHVIDATRIPSILVELGFISNPTDAAKLGSPTYRQRSADAIYYGTVNFYN
ncbi:cell wall-binding repeat-containing protein [Fictibacillus norfolkensis]|uniref:N-acetylmuramoyl-L-alanine amidase n=1 Tax=Fictibacillus norfolkensis TaxID=2762233 RepID=A0ABR8SIK5_9BACL|nr:cell wall-binding repeat-containing protein [Fictibacillus norfolkensis]MBD7963169.1 N-acetylmuramoyl-L-alanine amidase [Fictibacillus norfolkensis]